MTLPIDRKRRRHSVTEHLRDLTRQLAAFEHSLESFGEDFAIEPFRAAFESAELDEYSRAQLVEHTFSRVQGYLAQLADDGSKLAGLERRQSTGDEPRAAPHFEALRDAGVLNDAGAQALIRGQRDRNVIEHRYVRVDADLVHAAAQRLRATAPDFIRRYRDWVAPFLRAE